MTDEGKSARHARNEPHSEAAIAQFEAAWLQGKRPAIEEFLPANGSRGDAAEADSLVWELVHAELEFRVKAGEAARVEEYLVRFPQLASDRKRLAELVRGEYELARRRKPGVELAEYLARFPDLADELQTRLREPAPVRRRAALRLNCPHCQNPIEIVADETSEELVCPSCGSNFHLEHEKTLTWSAERLPKLGKFELIAAVGRGAFGTVYRARDTQLDRIVAVKLPRSGTLGSDADEDRFIRDARSTAQLRHPGIVPVYEVGRSETFPYIVMEFVEGTTLADVLTARRLSFRESAELLMRVAEALEHAHQQGIVHRDLKPSNIMLSPDGSPRLMDFGLAKRDAGEITMTMDGQILGTPAYMSPEQAAGDAHKADARSDIYSLGVILYQLLTGELPFRGNMRMLVQQVLHDEPRAPRKLNDRVPRDLETICLKAMAKEPSRRYQRADEFANDVQHWLAGRPIVARPIGRVNRGWRWCKRNPVVASLMAVIVTLLASLTIGASLFATRMLDLAAKERSARAVADENADKAMKSALVARQQKDEALRQGENARRLLYVANVNLAQRAWDISNIPRLKDLIGQIEPMGTEQDSRGWEWYYWQRLSHGELRTLLGHSNKVNQVVFSPDGRWLASAGADLTLKLWDAETGAEIRTLKGHGRYVESVAFSHDGRRLASASGDGTLMLWDSVTGATLRTFRGHKDRVLSVAFSPDDRRLVSAGADETVKLWDVETGAEIQTFSGHIYAVQTVAFSPDGRRLASGGADSTVKLWDADTCVEIRTLSGHTSNVASVAFSFDGRLLATGSSDRTLKMWDAETGAIIRTLKGHTSFVTGVAFSPDTRWLASASADRTLKLWDAETGVEIRTFKGHDSVVSGVAFSIDGQRLASASWDKSLKLWDTETGAEFRTIKGHTLTVRGIAFSPDNRRLVSASDDGTLKLWAVENGAGVRSLNGHEGQVLGVAFSTDGLRLASASADQTLKLWNLETGAEIRTLKGHAAYVESVAFSPDGHRLASASRDRTLKLWDVETGTEIRTLKGHARVVRRVAFRPDGRQLASASEDGTIKLWDVENGTVIRTLRGHAGFVESVAFDRSGRRLASGGYDATIKLWDVETGAKILTLDGHSSFVVSIMFSPDGRRLASASEDQTLKLWDTESGAELFSVSWPNRAESASFSPDGKLLATAFDDTVVLLDSRDFTPDEKMGTSLARQILKQNPALNAALAEVDQRGHWTDAMREAARKYIESSQQP